MKTLLLALLVLPACCFAAPTISVTVGGASVADGGFVDAARNQPVSSLQIVITVNSTDGSPVSLVGTVSNVTTQAIAESEFSAAAAIGPYNVTPTSGAFDVGSVTHIVSLTASDGINPDATFSFEIRVDSTPVLPAACYGPKPEERPGCAASVAVAPSALAMLALMAVAALRRRRC
ncbi:MAG: hypothetical protein IT464_11440 [Planctomycetes bacterium]|nr:hypothetical protein [Planctomycetota bacterium]